MAQTYYVNIELKYLQLKSEVEVEQAHTVQGKGKVLSKNIELMF